MQPQLLLVMKHIMLYRESLTMAVATDYSSTVKSYTLSMSLSVFIFSWTGRCVLMSKLSDMSEVFEDLTAEERW